MVIHDDLLTIRKEEHCDEIHQTWSGWLEWANMRSSAGEPVLYVTERCVFELTPNGLKLIEVAPGIDVERDILAQMALKPIVGDDVRLMDDRIPDTPMGLAERFSN